MGYDVIYGDTDSLMINTTITNYDQVSKIGIKIKQEINKLYRLVELDIDGVFKYLLLLKKKKYAAVILSKAKNGELKSLPEYKGLDIVRRDWSKLASETGKFVLDHILSDQNADDRIANILAHLRQLKDDLIEGKVPISLLTITKQLSKNPNLYPDVKSLPHVQVALRYNKNCGGHLRAGDTVPYVICDDGSGLAATQRAYHVEEVKNGLKIDYDYYLAQQIYPVVSRICEPIEQIDLFQVAECLGIDSKCVKKMKSQTDDKGENFTKPEVKFRNVDKFVFRCLTCKRDNVVESVLKDNVPVLQKCCNETCEVKPFEYVFFIKNQMVETMNFYVIKYYKYEMYCEDPMCMNETNALPMEYSGRYPICTVCRAAILLRKYTERDLYYQLLYFQYIFDLRKVDKSRFFLQLIGVIIKFFSEPIMEYEMEKAYNEVRETVERRLQYCAYMVIDLDRMFLNFSQDLVRRQQEQAEGDNFETFDDDDDEFEEEFD